MKPRDLTQRYVESLRASGSRLEVRDARSRGLELRVTPQGTKTWLLRYRRKSDGKKRSVTLGRFPEMSLQEARQAALETRAAVGKGADPAGDQATLRAALTFRELATKRLDEDQTIGAGTRAAYQQSLSADVFPAIGDVPAASVTADMVARVLDAIEKRGRLCRPIARALQWVPPSSGRSRGESAESPSIQRLGSASVRLMPSELAF